MRTPYDAAIAVQRREVDRLSAEVAAEAAALAETEQAIVAVAERLRREGGAAIALTTVPTPAFFARIRSEAAHLEAQRRAGLARLDLLRADAREAYAGRSALEGAAERFRDAAERAEALAEQSEADDRAAAAAVRIQRAKRRRP